MPSEVATILAVAEEHGSQTPFYVLGGALAVFAVAVGALGIARHATFPPTAGAARGVMGLAALLVVATLAAAVLSG